MADGEDDVIVGQRVYSCELIQQMGIMLRLPQVAVATAQVMFHRFYARRSMRRFDVRVRQTFRRPSPFAVFCTAPARGNRATVDA